MPDAAECGSKAYLRELLVVYLDLGPLLWAVRSQVPQPQADPAEA